MTSPNGKPHDLVHADLIAEIAWLEKLTVDLRRMADDQAPVSSDFEGAPRIDRWRIMYRPVPYLVGIVSGHPVLRNGPITTSDVWVMDTKFGWARTMSRFYVLGDQAAPPPGEEGCGHG